MPGIYVDTSALGRVVLREDDAPLIRAVLARFDPWHASELLIVELRRLGRREGVEARAGRTLSLVTLAPLTTTVLEHAARLDPVNIKSLDASHMATAMSLHDAGDIGAVLTYDGQLQAGCTHYGIPFEAPVA